MTWDCCTPKGECQRGHGCPAGDDCKVARVGRKMHGPEPLTDSVWRRQLRYLAVAMLGAIWVIFISGIVVALLASCASATTTTTTSTLPDGSEFCVIFDKGKQ